MELQPRDRDILEVLSLRVRTLSLGQVARTWWQGRSQSVRQAQQRITVLVEAGLLELNHLRAHPELPLDAPLAVWHGGQPPPGFGELARCLRARWSNEAEDTTFVTATRSAGNDLGGHGGRRPRISEATHDLHLAAVYLRMRSELPTRARSWMPEFALRGMPGERVPDALVRDGRYNTAIEFGGEYPEEKLRLFHEDCARRGRGYEIW